MAKKQIDPLVKQLGVWKDLTRIIKSHAILYCYNHPTGWLYMKSILPYVEKLAVLRNWDESMFSWDNCLFPVPDMTTFCTKYRKTFVDITCTDTGIELSDIEKDANLTIPKLTSSEEERKMFDTCYTKLFEDRRSMEEYPGVTNFFYDNIDSPVVGYERSCFATEFTPVSSDDLSSLQRKQSICLTDPIYGESIYLSKPLFGDVKKTEGIGYVVLPPDIEGDSVMRAGKRYVLFRQYEPNLTIYTLATFASLKEDH